MRAAGVDVVALCGRTPAPAKAMAAKLGVAALRFDWRQTLEELRPEIVSIATPAAPHREMAEFAAGVGCHIMCDKPLGIDAQEARAMLAAVKRAGVKHAYGSTSRYAPVCCFRLTPDQLAEIPDSTERRRIIDAEGIFPPTLSPDRLPYSEWSRGALLIHLGMTHNYGHFYEVCSVCSLMGVRFWR